MAEAQDALGRWIPLKLAWRLNRDVVKIAETSDPMWFLEGCCSGPGPQTKLLGWGRNGNGCVKRKELGFEAIAFETRLLVVDQALAQVEILDYATQVACTTTFESDG